MRRLSLVINLLLLSCLLFAAGQQEEKPMELFIAGMGVGLGNPHYDYLMAPFIEEYPEVKLNHVPMNVKDATTMSMDMRIASGSPIHFYNDYFSRAGKYVIPKSAKGNIWALDLSKYWDDIDDFLPGALDPYWIDGELLGTPLPNMLVAMQVNLTILEKAGYVLPPIDDWTLEEFNTALSKTKAVNLPDVWPTMMFARNRSGDWHYMSYFSTFGAEIFANNDYTKSAVNTPAGLKVFEMWKSWQNEGLIPHEAAMLADDEFIPARDSGKLAFAGTRVGVPIQNQPGLLESLIEQGIIDEPYAIVHYNFPRAPGVDKVPMLTQWNVNVAFGSEDEAVNEVVARFAWHANSTRSQLYAIRSNKNFVTRKSAGAAPFAVGEDYAWWLDFKQMLLGNGPMDVGGTLPVYGKIRGALFPQLQKMFSDVVTPQEALDLYEAALNEVVAGL